MRNCEISAFGHASRPHCSLPFGPWAAQRLSGSSPVRSAAMRLESPPREARAASCGTSRKASSTRWLSRASCLRCHAGSGMSLPPRARARTRLRGGSAVLLGDALPATCGACSVHVRCVCSARAVRVQCTCGACAVHVVVHVAAAMCFLQSDARETHALDGLTSGRGVGRMGMRASVW